MDSDNFHGPLVNYQIPYPLQNNARILFSKMTFWGFLRQNLGKVQGSYQNPAGFSGKTALS